MSDSNLAGETDAEFEARRAGFERILIHPHLESELEWLRTLQSTTVDEGLKQISVRKYCVLFNLVSAGLALKMFFWGSAVSEPNILWIAGFVIANVATIGIYLAVAFSLSSHRLILSKINERAKAIDAKLNGDMAIGSAIDARIW